MFSIIIVLIVAFLVIISTREVQPMPGTVRTAITNQNKTAINFAWPNQGQAAIGTSESGLKSVHGDNEQHPTASLAKVITALVVLDAKPFSGDGPLITMTEEDVLLYQQTVAVNGSFLYVEIGEQLTERQMIEAMMLPSANNISDTLVRWAFGSQENYKIVAEKWLSENNLHSTTIGNDASGLDPSTTSSVSDLFEIARIALDHPILSEIMAEPAAVFPLIGEVLNTNSLLRDNDGFIGLKTGTSIEADACLMFAAKREIGGHDTTIVGVLLGQTFGTTFDTARAMTQSAVDNIAAFEIPVGTIVGEYNVPWDGTVNAVTTEDISGLTWADEDPSIVVKLEPIQPPIYGNQNIGQISFGNTTVGVRLNNIVASPDLIWKVRNLSELKWEI